MSFIWCNRIRPVFANRSTAYDVLKTKLGISPNLPCGGKLTCLSDADHLNHRVFRHELALFLCIFTMRRLLTSSHEYNSDINSVIMDYLISEGYPSAAQKFALEANIQPKVDVESIEGRVEIRNAIYGGDIQTAVEKINEMNPQVSPWFLCQGCTCWRQCTITFSLL